MFDKFLRLVYLVYLIQASYKNIVETSFKDFDINLGYLLCGITCFLVD